MKKVLLPLLLGLSSFTFANDSILDSTSNVSIIELANLGNFFSTHNGNDQKILQELEQKYGKLPDFLKYNVSSKFTSLQWCRQSDSSYDKLSRDATMASRSLTEEICNSTLENYFGNWIEQKRSEYKPMNFKEYQSMSVADFALISDYNLDEFQNYIREDYGVYVSSQFQTLKGGAQKLCHDKETIQYATPKQRKEFKALCDKKIKDVLKEYE